MWQKYLFLPLLLLSLVLAACSGSSVQTVATKHTPAPTPQGTPSPTANTTISVTLAPKPNQASFSAAQLEAAGTMLAARLTAFGFTGVQVSQTTVNDQPALQITVPHFSSNESDTLDALLATGQLDFWLTGSSPVEPQTTFDPEQYAVYNPGDQPPFTGADLDPASISLGTDVAGRPQINFAMKSSSSTRFYTFTSQNIQQYLTITLDGVVIQSAIIQSPINGPGVISGNFTLQEAKILVSVLKYAPLTVLLQKASEVIATDTSTSN